MKRLCGLDINGWRVFAARSWMRRPGEDPESVDCAVIDGGINPAAVRTGDSEEGTEVWIGGPQALLAPHGRGSGWGEIGEEDRRIPLRDCIAGLSDSARFQQPFAAALEAFAAGSDYGVLSLEDSRRTTEIAEERMIAAMGAVRIRRRLLVWRPVLAALYAIRTGAVEEGQTVGVVCHAAEGFSIQRLTIRREDMRHGAVLAPERRRPGKMKESPMGYSGLCASAAEAVRVQLPDRIADHAGTLRAVACLSLGLPADPELIRLPNGGWELLNPPDEAPIPETADLDQEAFSGLDVVLLETLSEGSVRSAAEQLVARVARSPVRTLPVTAVAEAALEAARRLDRGDPVYFDFLPQISTIVQSATGAANYDLIGEHETLPAGRLYRSSEPARFALQAGQEMILVYLRKEEATKPRRARIKLPSPVTAEAPVELWVEQIPAAGRAKVVLQSPALPGQMIVDWEQAAELDEDWDDIIRDLAMPPPTIPERLVLPCGMKIWQGHIRRKGLAAIVAQFAGAGRINGKDWKLLGDQMARRELGRHGISSDGKVPYGLQGKTRENLRVLTGRAVEHLHDRLAGRANAKESGSLRFLTWQFRHCPEQVGEILLDAISDPHGGGLLMSSASNRTLTYQGLGRIAASPEMQQRALRHILSSSTAGWNWRQQTACAAFLLSRSDDTPRILTRSDVERLAGRTLQEFRECLGTRYTKFYYAPFLMVGLLRWRLVERRSLVAGIDPVADEMLKAVENALPDIKLAMKKYPERRSKISKFISILNDIRKELRGKGTNPNLLLDIYSARGG